MTAVRDPRPSKARFVPFYVPQTDADEVGEVTSAIRSGWLTTGPKVTQLEDRIRRMVGARHAVAVNSCTAAMHLALAALGVSRNDEVITSPYTFAATGEAILYQGAKPVFVDIDPLTLNIDPRGVERAVTRRTRVLLPVHMAGLPCDLKALQSIARKRRLRLVEDAAHALGAAIGNRSLGAVGDVTCFSFYATKNLTTGEGGMATTEDPRIAQRLRRLSLHGLTHDAWKRYTRSGSWRYDVVELGYKYNMTDVAAGLGLAQLRKFRGMQRRRARLAARYSRLLQGEEAFDLPAEVRGTRHAWHLYILRFRPGVLRVSRDQVIEILRRRGIGTSVHFQPLHLFTYYRRTFGYRPGDFPHTERESSRALSLPLYPGLSRDSQDRVIEELHGLARRFRR